MSPGAAPEHVGSALRHRRQLVAVSLQDIIDVAGHGHVADVKWIEAADHPSTRRIMWHYAWVVEAAKTRGTWDELPYAQRQQWYDTALDEALWKAVREKVGTRLWWWGRARGQGPSGAVCYVCGARIYTYEAGRPMTGPARIAMMSHRALHAAAGSPAPRTYEQKAA